MPLQLRVIVRILLPSTVVFVFGMVLGGSGECCEALIVVSRPTDISRVWRMTMVNAESSYVVWAR